MSLLHVVRHRRPARRTVEIGAGRRHLRVVRPHGIPRPRWGVLYVIVAGIGAIGFVATGTADSPVAERLVELLMAGTLMAAIALWLRANRVAVALADEPLGTASESVVSHVVRSRRSGRPRLRPFGAGRVDERTRSKKVVRLHPEDNVVLPYDVC